MGDISRQYLTWGISSFRLPLSMIKKSVQLVFTHHQYYYPNVKDRIAPLDAILTLRF